MAGTAKRAPDYHVVLHALEVLRLMDRCLESGHDVDCDELHTVLGFLKDCAECQEVRALLIELVDAGPSDRVRELTRSHLSTHSNVIFDRSRFVQRSVPAPDFNRQLYRLESKYIDPHCI